MPTDYDRIASQYRESKTLPFREYIEWFSYRKMLGDVAGKSILDLACGEGFYSRRLKQAGARKVVGVDISDRMIELAEARENKEPLGITYLVDDVLSMGEIGRFDLVVASYLLNYAQTELQLLKMCQTIAANLEKGGRFVSINNNPDQPPETFDTCRKYGFTKRLAGPLEEGAGITYEFFRDGQKFKIENYFLKRQTHEQAFKQVGFKTISWVDVHVSADGIQRFGRDYWQDFIDHQPIVGIECRQ